MIFGAGWCEAMKAPKVLIPLDFPMGLFLGAVSVAAVVVIGNAVTSPNWATVYAAVIGGLFAVVAVWGALYGVSLQVRAQAELLDQQRLARLEAERALLPLALDQLCEVCDNQIARLVTGVFVSTVRTHLSDEMIHAIKSCIEPSVGDARQHLVDLLAIYQICTSKSFGSTERLAEDDLPIQQMKRQLEKLNRIVDIFRWISLRARATNSLKFARGREDCPKWEPVFEIADMLVRTLCDSGTFGGWCLTNDPDYERLMLSGRIKGRYGFTHRDWRDTY